MQHFSLETFIALKTHQHQHNQANVFYFVFDSERSHNYNSVIISGLTSKV